MTAQSDSAKDRVLPGTCAALRRVGLAIHLLHPTSKRPIGDGWSNASVASLETLRSAFRPGHNIGVRLGEPSRVAGGYLHAFDIDVRCADVADEAIGALRALLPDLDFDTLPSVISGSGGASRHIYFVCDKPLHSRKLWVSGEKVRDAKGKWHNTAEIDLFGTGRQCVLPPSIHPDTGKPYVWERPFDFDLLDMGVAPTICADRLSKISDPVLEDYEFEAVEPLTFKAGQLEAELDELSIDHIDEYHDWVTLGQALHHQFGGSSEGYDLWVACSKRSEKFDPREMPGKWRSFGRSRRRPVTMASVRQWILDERRQSFVASLDGAFDDLPEPGVGTDGSGEHHTSANAKIVSLLGGAADIDPLDEEASDDPLDAPVSMPWQSLLDFNEDGGIRATLHNIRLLVQHDPRTAGIPEYNLFTGDVVQRRVPGLAPSRRQNAAKPAIQLRSDVWEVRDLVNGTLWNDARDNDIRSAFEAPKSQGGYGFKISDRDLKAAVDLVARQNQFHPVREYFESIRWDGVPRAERLFIDYLGSPNDTYHREVARLMLIAGVTRIYEPGHKWDTAIIIEGKQGVGKSTFIRCLGRNWFAELEGHIGDHKQMIEQLMGAFVLEIPELSGFGKADVQAIKAFISRTTDRGRLAYARRTAEFPRQSIMVGSTNDSTYLGDLTGGRRFLPVACSVASIDGARLEKNIDQIWGEALHLYRRMREQRPKGTLPLYLQGEALQIAKAKQETRTHESAEASWAGQIAAWLDQPVLTGDLSIDGEEPQFRDAVCALEIWLECFRREHKDYDNRTARAIGRAMEMVTGWSRSGTQMKYKQHGSQRAYRRNIA